MSDSGPANKARRNMLAAALAAGATAPTMAGIISTNSSEPNMAASLLSQPKQLFQEANRNPMVGGQFFTYAAGTLTPKTTYQDAALTIANTNPTIVNARGELLMYGAGTYRVILKDAAGNTIYDVDNIESSQSIVDSLVAILQRRPVPLWLAMHRLRVQFPPSGPRGKSCPSASPYSTITAPIDTATTITAI